MRCERITENSPNRWKSWWPFCSWFRGDLWWAKFLVTCGRSRKIFSCSWCLPWSPACTKCNGDLKKSICDSKNSNFDRTEEQGRSSLFSCQETVQEMVIKRWSNGYPLVNNFDHGVCNNWWPTGDQMVYKNIDRHPSPTGSQTMASKFSPHFSGFWQDGRTGQELAFFLSKLGSLNGDQMVTKKLNFGDQDSSLFCDRLVHNWWSTDVANIEITMYHRTTLTSRGTQFQLIFPIFDRIEEQGRSSLFSCQNWDRWMAIKWWPKK